MPNSWMVVAIKVADKPANYLTELVTERVDGDLRSGTLQGGYLRARRFVNKLSNIIFALSGGAYHGNLWATVFDGAGALPAGNIACTQANAAGDTITFTFGTLTIVFTEGATGAQGFARGADNTATALNLGTAINNHPVLKGIIKATPAAGNCALAGKIPTSLLHHVVMSTNDGTAFSFTQLTGGVPGTATLFPQSVATAKNPV